MPRSRMDGETPMNSSSLRALRAPAACLLSAVLSWLAPHALAASDEIFASGFQPLGYAIPLASPDGADYLYTAQVTVGDQTFAMDIDTGSATLAVAGATCTTGCTGISPLYTPSASAASTGHTVSSLYADGSGWSGSTYSDTVGLGNGSPSVSLDLVEITHATGGFFDSNNGYQGILGLGTQGLAQQYTTGFIPVVVGTGLDNTFAFDLCDNPGANAGTMWLGGDGGAGSMQYTPLVPIDGSNPFYAINVDGMSLGGTSVATNASNLFQQPVIDTGTSLFYVPTSVYVAFKTALQASAGFKAVFGSNAFSGSDCVADASVTDDEVESMLPQIALSLPNATSSEPDVTIQASALDTYLYNAGGGQYCLALQDGGTVDPSTFGDAFMQAFHTVIDVDGGRVGFAPPTGCPAPAAMHRILRPARIGPHRHPRPPRP